MPGRSIAARRVPASAKGGAGGLGATQERHLGPPGARGGAAALRPRPPVMRYSLHLLVRVRHSSRLEKKKKKKKKKKREKKKVLEKKKRGGVVELRGTGKCTKHDHTRTGTGRFPQFGWGFSSAMVRALHGYFKKTPISGVTQPRLGFGGGASRCKGRNKGAV